MPKATLTFDLPEEESDFKHATNGLKYLITMQELYNELRSKSKHGNEVGSWAEAYDLVKQVCYDNNFDPWEE